MKNLNIKIKIAFLTGGLMIAIVCLGAFGVYSSRSLSSNLHKLTDNDLDIVRGVALIDMYHDGLRGIVTKGELGVKMRNKEFVTEAQTEANEMSKEARGTVESINAKVLTPQFKENFGAAQIEINNYLTAAHDFFEVAMTGNEEKSSQYYGQFEQEFKKLEVLLEKLANDFESENKSDVDQMLGRANTLELTSLFVLVGILIAGVFFSFAVGRSIVVSLSQISRALSIGAGELGAAISQLSSASSSLSSSAQQQASALQETAASAEEISSMVKKTSDSAVQSETASGKSREKAEIGQKAIEDMVDAIQEINRNNDTVMTEVTAGNERISEIVKVIQEIGNKTKVINDIVFQTKLLSFNASVEAARAGEHGKGFAVVAEEVGNLAAMSGNAAKEITTLLDSSLQRVGAIVAETKSKVETLMVTSRQTVNRGAAVAEQCSEVFRDIVEGAKNVGDMVSSISQASQEQANGVTEISKAINQLNQATHVNATAAEDCSRATETLTQQVLNLKSASTDLNKIVDGKQEDIKLEWNESLKSGNVRFDFAHQKVFEAFNQFFHLCTSGGSASTQLAARLGEAVEKLGNCFDSEIDYLEETGAEFEGHDKAHQSLLSGIGEFQAAISQNHFSPRELLNYLNKNYLAHIQGMDRTALNMKKNSSFSIDNHERAA